MENEYILERLETLNGTLIELKNAVKRAEENTVRRYVDRVKYMVNGLSIVVTDIGHKFIAENEGKIINGVILESPLNVRDIFVKLGEVQIIPGKSVPHLKQLIKIASSNTVNLDDVTRALPSVEVFIFFLKTYLKGVDLSDEVMEEIELFQRKEVEDEKARPH